MSSPRTTIAASAVRQNRQGRFSARWAAAAVAAAASRSPSRAIGTAPGARTCSSPETAPAACARRHDPTMWRKWVALVADQGAQGDEDRGLLGGEEDNASCIFGVEVAG